MQSKKDKIIKWIIIGLFAVAIITAIVLSCVLINTNKNLDDMKDQNTQIEEQLDNLE